jgi:DNA-binding LacI/PurR family transcriptional regulator
MANRVAFSGFRPACVADQAATALREAIRRRIWENVLPSENELARQLGISRSSLRAAMAQLAREGLIEIRPGQCSRLRAVRRNRSTAPAIVCMITPVSREDFHPAEHSQILQVHAQFADRGIGWEEIFDAGLGRKHPERRLEELVAGRHGVCWLLVLASAPMQRWFEKSGVPAMVIGSCHQGVKLPSVDADYRAIGWHAAGGIAKLGHRHAAFLFPQRPMPGDLACRDGFLAYLARRNRAIVLTEVPIPEGQSAVLTKIQRLLLQDSPPTAFLSLSPRNTFTILIYLLQAEVKIPQDVSVVACNTHLLLEETVPGLARYRVSSAKLALRVVRIARSLLAGHAVPPKANLIMPKFVRGASLGEAPKPKLKRPIRLSTNLLV